MTDSLERVISILMVLVIELSRYRRYVRPPVVLAVVPGTGVLVAFEGGVDSIESKVWKGLKLDVPIVKFKGVEVP
jgi:hypothetical protein